jgi:UDP-glucose 4-epimerase
MKFKKKLFGKKVLITGGLGMIGSNLAHALVKAGAKVAILDASLPLYGSNKFNLKGIENQIEVIAGDIRSSFLMGKAVKGKDFIFHLAAQVSYIDSMIDPLVDLDINCRGHLILLEACRKANPKAKIIFSGSRMEYGKIQSIPVTEEHPTNPLMFYGIHKLTAEKYNLLYWNNFGIPSVTVRITNPYGPRQQMRHAKYGIINWFIRQAMGNKDIFIFGDGKQIRDYIYIEDIVDGLLAVAVSPKTAGKVYNLGSGKGTKFIDMAKMVIETVGKGQIKNVVWPKNYQNIETGNFVADISKISRQTGWHPKINLREGIAKTVGFYKDNWRCYW